MGGWLNNTALMAKSLRAFASRCRVRKRVESGLCCESALSAESGLCWVEGLALVLVSVGGLNWVELLDRFPKSVNEEKRVLLVGDTRMWLL